MPSIAKKKKKRQKTKQQQKPKTSKPAEHKVKGTRSKNFASRLQGVIGRGRISIFIP
jgi:hypothetical protein